MDHLRGVDGWRFLQMLISHLPHLTGCSGCIHQLVCPCKLQSRHLLPSLASHTNCCLPGFVVAIQPDFFLLLNFTGHVYASVNSFSFFLGHFCPLGKQLLEAIDALSGYRLNQIVILEAMLRTKKVSITNAYPI